MKKILFLAAMALAMVGCKKESPLSPVSKETKDANEQVASLIEKADAGLYNAVYNPNHDSKAPTPSVRYCPGIFVVLQGDPASGTCFSAQCVCFVIVNWKMYLPREWPEAEEITEDIHEGYTEPGEAEVVFNASPDPITVENLKSFHLEFDGGDASTHYEVLDL